MIYLSSNYKFLVFSNCLTVLKFSSIEMLSINNFCSTRFPLYSKGCKITSVSALLSGVCVCLLVALLIVPLCWWLFAIVTASSHSSILNESHVVPITNQQNSSHNESLIIDHLTKQSLQTTVSSTVSSNRSIGTNELTTRVRAFGYIQ